MHKMVNWLLILCLSVMTAACVGTPQPAAYTVTTADPAINPGLEALGVARAMLGVAYRYGGADPGGFDCSGLVWYAFSQTGIELPRTSMEIFRSSQLVNPNEMQAGDLLFFTIAADKVSHIGIYDDHTRFIHAPSSGKGVSYASLAEAYWSKRLVAVGRVTQFVRQEKSAQSSR